MSDPSSNASPLPGTTQPPGTPFEVLRVFLRLGLTSFGGPVAHLGYFRQEFVERRRWLDDRSYADLVALCQFLPGPASSQVGMALGLQRAGWAGALAAWAGFTLPSAFALILFALGVARWESLAASGAVQGLKIVAVAVVAQAVWGMSRSLCPDRPRAAIAFAAILLALAMPGASGQILAIGLGAIAGWRLLDDPVSGGAPPLASPVSRRTGTALLLLFALLLLGLPVAAALVEGSWLQPVAVFYQAGSLVFGGGHVVLPLLQAAVVPPGWVDDASFLAGYGAAQAVPGPLFTFAAFLGAAMPAPFGGLAGGLSLLLAIFMPAFLLVAGALPWWAELRRHAVVQRALGGINAAVVGLLAAALYDPVFTDAIGSRADLALALAAFGLLVVARWSPLRVVLLAAAAGWSMRLVAPA
jgi:chromate transporter